MPSLGRSGLEQVQDDLRILGVVLVPGVVHRFPRAGQRQGCNQPQHEPLSMEKVRQRAMIIARSLKPDDVRGPNQRRY
jgi:hypothetical protein